ncbi:hypothetical protein AUC71_02965 [Methyloceanibacter marginalis]|uniref:DUF3489 domain-containing protein n=1 Tax=Methyloceanibacter marginalis TaxID=1774971 RepID=A0A1E3W7Q9_9HYPH|nr:DUF3489 domain-containing protein [Methyloceanibacter marginalis]ODS01868.1 hypothetical protein AUC71_02965 [Methyloceanibacter marginalis]
MEAIMPKSQPETAKLSDAQLVILSAAAQRPDGSLLPLPESLAKKGAAQNRVMIEILCKRKLAEEKQTKNDASEWRRDKEGRPLGLFITKSGLLALGINETEETKPARAAASLPRQRKTAAPRSKARKASVAKPKERATPAHSKQQAVIKMLRRKSGVTIDDIVAETGWQRHSVRGFFAGLVKKKLKLPLVSAVNKDGVRRYYIAPIGSAKE